MRRWLVCSDGLPCIADSLLAGGRCQATPEWIHSARWGAAPLAGARWCCTCGSASQRQLIAWCPDCTPISFGLRKLTLRPSPRARRAGHRPVFRHERAAGENTSKLVLLMSRAHRPRGESTGCANTICAMATRSTRSTCRPLHSLRQGCHVARSAPTHQAGAQPAASLARASPPRASQGPSVPTHHGTVPSFRCFACGVAPGPMYVPPGVLTPRPT